jgi:hypothetical protein
VKYLAKSSQRLFAIKPDEGHLFFAGITPESEQVLMGLYCPNLLAFYFDSEGTLLRSEEQPVPFFQNVTTPRPYDIYDDRIQPLINAWQADMKLRSKVIHVKRFWSEEHSIGIEEYPSHFHEILSDLIADEEEKTSVRKSLQQWDEDGQFVLHWGNEYWLDRTGEVVSS